ncbi:hypothetical protein BU23DRAFT_501277 [Bimuria novae-zelandiae CBS 107.79]|uniref:Nephrocystin 3-like N-terminal domain-containing protein n=1 Tax=Bimuria novae-zelandiae CBS 107.79 TaxID=1447943 RepID=A0A6A5VM74_9PLEO|nr:hypothetical protein BU23DRAFT_501277 [Bimuria novae-zelandiae CBS 107.79]
MDPITAVSLAASILQFVTLDAKILSTAKEIRQSSSGMAHDDQRTADVTKEMQKLSSKLEAPATELLSDDERGLVGLASECRELKLAHCRAQLHLHLSYVSSNTQVEKMEALATSLHELQNGLASGVLPSEGERQENPEILRLPHRFWNTLAERHIIRSLDHPEFRQRFENVEKAHAQTFRWILEEDRHLESHQLSASRNMFCRWLSQENEIFHIAGKLGSGKSTLMKFLCNHPKSMSELHRWYSIRRLALVHFFFWRPGSDWQHSPKGLVRSLLHDTLLLCPELIPLVLPELWTDATKERIGLLLTPSFYREEACFESALERLLNCPKIRDTHRFCFFIHGLDEQDEASPQNDHKALVNLIQGWEAQSQGSRKICVSSREHNVFMNSFNAERRLRLQGLTQNDMQRYFEKKFEDIVFTGEAHDLAKEIVERSQGIFLWLVLVVRALRESLEDGHDFLDFKAVVDSLPDKVEARFAYLLNTIPKARKKNVFHLFTIVPLFHFPLLTILSLNKYLRGLGHPLHAVQGPKHTEAREDGQTLVEKQRQRSAQLVQARKMVYGDCRGLLETR